MININWTNYSVSCGLWLFKKRVCGESRIENIHSWNFSLMLWKGTPLGTHYNEMHFSGPPERRGSKGKWYTLAKVWHHLPEADLRWLSSSHFLRTSSGFALSVCGSEDDYVKNMLILGQIPQALNDWRLPWPQACCYFKNPTVSSSVLFWLPDLSLQYSILNINTWDQVISC